VDELDRILWKKAVELTRATDQPKCCAVNYSPGRVLRDVAQSKNAVWGVRLPS